MSFSHNSGADFAASELARMIVADPMICHGMAMPAAGVSASASYEPPSSPWPKADGLVSLIFAGGREQRDIAIEFKRQQEGVHGLLTAMGQAQGYLHKGYNGAAIIVPTTYPTHSDPSLYVKSVLDRIGGSEPIGVFRYDEPDIASPTPFAGRLHCVKPMNISAATPGVGRIATAPKTQWVHMREGSTTRDAFFRFLQMAKRLSTGEKAPQPHIPAGLRNAAKRLAPGKTAEEYLSSTTDDRLLSRVWRAFWFEWVATTEVLTAWVKDGTVYRTPGASTRIEKDDATGKSGIFEGRANGLKETLIEGLNSGALTEDEAWEGFASGIMRAGGQRAQGVSERAHSYREDLDSSLAHLRWIDSDGRPTDHGYRYMNLCERFGGANAAIAIDYVGATLLQSGHYGSFLHYVHRLSEKKFMDEPLAFTNDVRGRPVFNEASYGVYLNYLEDELADNLKVMRKVSGRGRPRIRTPFQAELTLLRNYGFVSKKRYRLGVGIPIDWERVHEAMNVAI
jgi:hypothetical protein